MLLTRDEVEALLKIKTTALYDMMRRRGFPRPVKLTPKCVRWRQSEIDAWIDSQPKSTGDGIDRVAIGRQRKAEAAASA